MQLSERFVRITFSLLGVVCIYGLFETGIPSWLLIGAFSIWLGLIGRIVAKKWFGFLETTEAFLFGLLITGTVFSLGLTALYLLANITPITLAVFLGWTTCATLILAPFEAINIEKTTIPSFPSVWSFFLFIIFLLSDFFLILFFYLSQTDIALVSPWILFGTEPFLFFIISTWALLNLAHEYPSKHTWILSCIHFFTAFSTASLVYTVGFGFDPFIHRAAETALFQNGFINPTSFLYSGQYALITSLAHITHLTIRNIDIWLLPVLAAITLPPFVTVGLNRGYRIINQQAFLWMHTILILPFISLVFTVPYNIGFLLFALVLLLLPFSLQQSQTKFLCPLLAITSFTFHPLIGLPTLILTTLFLGWNLSSTEKHKKILSVVGILASTFSIPLLFAVYQTSQGLPALSFSNPFDNIGAFFALFSDPYFPDHTPPFYWTLLYKFHQILPIVIPILTIFLLAKSKHPLHKLYKQPFLIFIFGTYGSTLLLSTLFVFKNIIIYEQLEFAQRLVSILPLACLPFLLTFLPPLWKKTTLIRKSIFLLVLSVEITSAWYMSYPQVNPKTGVGGFSVSAADIEVVHEIEKQSEGKPYLVLSNQMTAAAALQEFGFAHYVNTQAGKELWYPIPTGGPLYPFFLKMTYEEPTRKTIEEAAEFAKVNTVFFVVYGYWDKANTLAQTVEKTADSLTKIDNGAIILFKYDTLYENQ